MLYACMPGKTYSQQLLREAEIVVLQVTLRVISYLVTYYVSMRLHCDHIRLQNSMTRKLWNATLWKYLVYAVCVYAWEKLSVDSQEGARMRNRGVFGKMTIIYIERLFDSLFYNWTLDNILSLDHRNNELGPWTVNWNYKQWDRTMNNEHLKDEQNSNRYNSPPPNHQLAHFHLYKGINPVRGIIPPSQTSVVPYVSCSLQAASNRTEDAAKVLVHSPL